MKLKKKTLRMFDKATGYALLVAAVFKKEVRAVKLLLASQNLLDINHKGEEGRTALHWAVGSPEIVSLLLQYGANSSITDDQGVTPLQLALANRHTETALIFVSSNDVNHVYTDGCQALHYAVMYNDCQVLYYLLDHGADVKATTEDGRTPVMLASIGGHTLILETLLQNGASVEPKSDDMVSPLYLATLHKNYTIMEMLLSHGANPNAVAGNKHPPLVACVLQGDEEGSSILLQHNADPNASLDDISLLHLAIVKQEFNLVALLIESDSDLGPLRQLIKDCSIVYHVSERGILKYLTTCAQGPLSLQRCCRKAIRNCVQSPVQSSLKKLDIPGSVIQFLCLGDLKGLKIM